MSYRRMKASLFDYVTILYRCSLKIYVKFLKLSLIITTVKTFHKSMKHHYKYWKSLSLKQNSVCLMRSTKLHRTCKALKCFLSFCYLLLRSSETYFVHAFLFLEFPLRTTLKIIYCETDIQFHGILFTWHKFCLRLFQGT